MEANASRYHGKAPDEIDWTDTQRQRRAVAEYLAALDEAAEPDPDRKPPKVISPSDPSSAWTAKANKRVQFGYGLNYLIDIENAVIVDVEATPARTYDEVAATKTMIERTEAQLRSEAQAARCRHGLWNGQVPRLAGQGDGITPHIPVWEKGKREDGTFSRSDFTFDKERGRLQLPGGKVLTDHRHGARRTDDALSRLASAIAMLARSSRSAARTMPARRIPRDVNEDARDVARRKMKTKAFAKSRDERKRVEMRFAHLKTHHGFERMRLRGLSGARDEFHLAAIVQNLKTMALRLLGPPPQPACA